MALPLQNSPDPLHDLVAELAALEAKCEHALWAGRDPDREPGPEFIAGSKVRDRVQQLIDATTRLRSDDETARPFAIRDRTALPPVPAGVLLGLADLLPVIRPALRVARRLARHRDATLEQNDVPPVTPDPLVPSPMHGRGWRAAPGEGLHPPPRGEGRGGEAQVLDP